MVRRLVRHIGLALSVSQQNWRFSMANDGVLEILHDMCRLTTWLKQSDEQTEARVRALNVLVRFLTATVEMPPIKVLGDMVIAPDPPAHSDQPQTVTILQIALIAPHGLGVVFWSPEARDRAEAHPDGLEGVAANYFTPYDGLEARHRRIVNAYLSELHDRVAAELGGPE
jgi:hypothetical protein